MGIKAAQQPEFPGKNVVRQNWKPEGDLELKTHYEKGTKGAMLTMGKI